MRRGTFVVTFLLLLSIPCNLLASEWVGCHGACQFEGDPNPRHFSLEVESAVECNPELIRNLCTAICSQTVQEVTQIHTNPPGTCFLKDSTCPQ